MVRMGHTMFALNQYIVLIGGHTKEWKGQSLTFRNLEDNLYILNTNTMEWKKCSIVNDGGNCLQRSLFMYSISGKCILVSIQPPQPPMYHKPLVHCHFCTICSCFKILLH